MSELSDDLFEEENASSVPKKSFKKRTSSLAKGAKTMLDKGFSALKAQKIKGDHWKILIDLNSEQTNFMQAKFAVHVMDELESVSKIWMQVLYDNRSLGEQKRNN